MSLDELVAEAEIGDEAKRFLESDLGKTILGMAQQEVDAAFVKFRMVDPGDKETVRAIQNEIWRAESFVQWLKELFDRGEAALHAFRQQRES